MSCTDFQHWWLHPTPTENSIRGRENKGTYMCSVGYSDGWWMACLCSHLPLRLISWISMTNIRPTRRMGQVIPTVVDVNQKARDHWIIRTFLWVLLSIYKEPVKRHTLEDYTQSPTEKDFAVSYYPTNTCQASYSDVQLISKIRWVFVQLHATTFWYCQLSAYILSENPDDLRPPMLDTPNYPWLI